MRASIVVLWLLSSLCKCNCGYYDFVIGYSTGHVGTTTLSSEELYNPADHIHFDFERFHIATNTWKRWKYEQEYHFSSNVVVPGMLQRRGSKKTYADFGHTNLYYADALIDYLAKTNYTFTVVRIRRSRYETAVSLSHSTSLTRIVTNETVDDRNSSIPHSLKETLSHPSGVYNDLCESWVRFCPRDRKKELLLPITPQQWKNLTIVQQALWLIDEVEARWQNILRRHPDIDRHEVSWGDDQPGSMSRVLESVATILRTNPVKSEALMKQVQQRKVHAPNETTHYAESLSTFKQLDEDYKTRIGIY